MQGFQAKDRQAVAEGWLSEQIANWLLQYAPPLPQNDHPKRNVCKKQNLLDRGVGDHKQVIVFSFTGRCVLLRILIDSIAQELGVPENGVRRFTVTQEYLSSKWVQPDF